MAVESINPATGEVVARYEEHSDAEISRRLELAAAAQREWENRDFASRGKVLHAAASELRRRKADLARLMALEMGKPVEQGKGEVEKCATCCDFFADNAERFLTRETLSDDGQAFVAYRPLGTLLAIMPWNFPLWQVFRAAVPSLMAGNAVVLKHASNVFGCALAIEEVFAAAGLPHGLFSSLLVGSRRVAGLIASPLISAVTLTGSTEAGRKVAAEAGQRLKKTVLELGGSDPYVVLEDADLKHAAEICATARLINSGQSCIAAKRFIVVREVKQRFEELFVEWMRSRKMGDPLDSATQIGPQARSDLRDTLHEQITRTVSAGATLRLGGERPNGPGAFYPATVLTNVRPGMAAFDEETFGPVAAVIEATDEAEAVRLANQTSFGLGAAVFTQDRARGERLATEALRAGTCVVNDYVKSDPRYPFGGIKDSGYGRELSSFGIREFVNIKTVCMR